MKNKYVDEDSSVHSGFVSITRVIWGWWDSTSVFPLLKTPPIPSPKKITLIDMSF